MMVCKGRHNGDSIMQSVLTLGEGDLLVHRNLAEGMACQEGNQAGENQGVEDQACLVVHRKA